MTNANVWTTVKLGDVASDINERVANPSQSGYDRFVGLDHLTQGDFTIRNWGSTEDVTSSMKLFKKGDVLFGRRNTYLKRASMAEFDGVCSGDAYVLRANPDYLVDGYLPLILNSSDLWDYANAHSAGGMSKRAKWRDLANYEIFLPPIEEQKQIAKILWAAEDVIVKNETFLAEAEHYKQLMMRDLFSKGIGHTEFKLIQKNLCLPPSWSYPNLGKIIDIYHGFGFKGEFFSKEPNGVLVLVPGNFSVFGGLEFNEKNKNYYHSEYAENFVLKNGDILTVMTDLSPKMLILGRTVKLKSEEIVLHNQRIGKIEIIQPNLISQDFLIQFMNSDQYRNNVFRSAAGSGVKHTSPERIKSINIPLPPLSEQKQIAVILTQIDETIAAARETIESTKGLKMKLINELLSPGGIDGTN